MKAIKFFVANVEKFAFILGIIALMILGTSCSGNRRPVGKSFEVVNFSGNYVIVNDSIATFQHMNRQGKKSPKVVYKLDKRKNKYFICK
jgi:hypothetical protein